ncbi:MAG: rhomboid family intramembrane serine protease [Planctomycetes bacterium]|nr:rhomboid family intramembrane serine protease [Planctomycetota bacterium]
MLSCPHCRRPLSAQPMAGGAAWTCNGCGGVAVSGGLLRSLVPAREALALAAGVRSARGLEQLPSCPSCRREMGRADAPSSALGIEVERCPSCDLWWLDRGEAGQAVDAAARLAAPVRKAQGRAIEQRRMEVQRSATLSRSVLEQRQQTPSGSDSRELELRLPSNGLKVLLTLFGMPAEEDAPRALALPWVTWSLAAITTAISIAALFFEPRLFDALALVPAEGGGPLGLHYLSCFLLHGSLPHLLGNLYFLIVFGDNVEDLLKPARYLVLLTAATAVAAFAHVLVDPRSELPLVGASGGISAIVVYYGLSLPKVKLSIFVLLFWVRISAFWALLVWFGLQLTGVLAQMEGVSDTSFAGHLGGAAVGLLAWFVLRPSSAQSVEGKLRRPRY